MKDHREVLLKPFVSESLMGLNSNIYCDESRRGPFVMFQVPRAWVASATNRLRSAISRHDHPSAAIARDVTSPFQFLSCFLTCIRRSLLLIHYVYAHSITCVCRTFRSHYPYRLIAADKLKPHTTTLRNHLCYKDLTGHF